MSVGSYFNSSFPLFLIYISLLDVEHAAAPATALAPGILPLPKLEYEGFEPSPYESDDARLELEDGTAPVSYIL
jgi:hypothetical protein